MRHVYAALLLCSCSSVDVVPDGGGGSAPGPAGGSATGGSDGGGGGLPSPRVIVVDLEQTELDPSQPSFLIVAMLSAPDGTVKGTWLNTELPVEALASNGDLVTYLHDSGSSWARSYRVTPEVTEVRKESGLPPYPASCAPGPPMTVMFNVPEVEGANELDVSLAGADFPLSWSPQSGTNEVEVTACATAKSFDFLFRAGADSVADPIAFARVDAIPYEPGSVATITIEPTSEQLLTDIVVEGAPGTAFRTHGAWFSWAFDLGVGLDTKRLDTIGPEGTTSLAYGPFAAGSGSSHVRVSAPPEDNWACELEQAWKQTPFDGVPLQLKLGALSQPYSQGDGNVALAGGGEVGDVIVRSEAVVGTNSSRWDLYEDPAAPYPLPVQPEVPADLLPGFDWPWDSAEVSYSHSDFLGVEGYADFARTNTDTVDGRVRSRVPADCP